MLVRDKGTGSLSLLNRRIVHWKWRKKILINFVSIYRIFLLCMEPLSIVMGDSGDVPYLSFFCMLSLEVMMNGKASETIKQ
jgi:hypothetical protein